MATFKQLLKQWKLDQYISKFEDEGWDDPSDWASLCDDANNEDLVELIDKKGHRNKFIRNFKSLAINKNKEDSKENDLKDDLKDDLKQDISEREIFPPGINIVPSKKREYRLPEKDYFKQSNNINNNNNNNTGSSAFGAVVNIITTVRDTVLNITGKNNITPETNAHVSQDQRQPEKLFSDNNHKIILVCGKTGAGKSTLINSMMNYIFNVQYNDKFRLKLIQEKQKKHGNADSCTDHVSSYTINKPKGGNINYKLTIVDTPGFGDTRGVHKDMHILDEFKYVFNTILTNIDGICFVVKSADNRLDSSQTYVFNTILNLWAKDVINNIFVLMTFADGKKANCIQALDKNEVLKNVKKRFKINNSAFTDDPLQIDISNDNQFDRLFWDMGMKCFKSFFDELTKVKPKAIEKSKQVLRQRDRIQTQIHHISMNLNNTLLKQQNIHQQKLFVKKHECEINSGKEVVQITTETEWRKFSVSNNLVTTCVKHQKSCHPGCGVSDKNNCCMMNSDGYCTVCTCPASKHINASYEYREVSFQQRISNWDSNASLKEQYNRATKK